LNRTWFGSSTMMCIACLSPMSSSSLMATVLKVTFTISAAIFNLFRIQLFTQLFDGLRVVSWKTISWFVLLFLLLLFWSEIVRSDILLCPTCLRCWSRPPKLDPNCYRWNQNFQYNLLTALQWFEINKIVTFRDTLRPKFL